MEQATSNIPTTVIAVGNQKGGVAKTTNTIHVAAALGERGRRCLIIDLDKNRGSTRSFGIPSDSFLGTFEILTGEEQPEAVIITNDEEGINLPPNVHIISARRNLEDVDITLKAKNRFVITQDVLIEPLKSLDGKYDYIFLDTPPDASTPTLAAYKAAKWFLLSAFPDPLAIEGLNDALVDIHAAQRNGNPDLRILGVVLSGIAGRKTRLQTELIDYVEKKFSVDGQPSAKFQTLISHSTIVPEASEEKKTVFQTNPGHKVAQQYRELAIEIEQRTGRLPVTGQIANVPEETARGVEGTEDVANG